MRFPEFTGKLKQLKLKDVSENIGGGTPPTSNKEFWNGTIPWISSSDVNINSISHINPTRFITAEAIKKSSTKLCPKDTIHVVTRVGLGKIIYTDYPLCTSQDFTNLINIKEDPKFLTYLLSKKLSNMSSQGSTIKGITTNELMALDIMVPDKDEQNKIANLLSIIDKRISIQRKLIENYESLIKTIMDRFFKNMKPIKYMKLYDISSIKTGKLNANAMTNNGQYAFFTCSKEDYKTDTFEFDGEAILIAGNGEVGLTKYYNGKFNAYQRTYVLQDFKVNAQYLKLYLENNLVRFLKTKTNTSAMSYITLATLESFNVPIIEKIEQNSIVYKLSIFNKYYTNLIENQNKLLKMKSYLNDNLFI